MKIPFTQYEMVLHRPGEVAHHSERRLAEPSRIADKILDGLPVKVRSTAEKATAQRIRSQFIALARKSEQSIGAGHTPAAMRMEAAAGDASWAEKNEAVANEALKMVRLALYNKKYGSYKSLNKFKFKPTAIEDEKKRVAASRFVDLDNFGGIHNLRHIAAIRSQRIWESRSIECDGLALAATDYIAYKHPNVQVSKVSVAGHTLAVVGTIEINCTTLPFSAWPAHLYVCDPWANIVCPAPEYPERFAQKMEKWQSEDKAIISEGRRILPTDENWVSRVKAVPRIFTRMNYQNGQFEYLAQPVFYWEAVRQNLQGQR